MSERNNADLPTKEEVLANEDQLLTGLLEAAQFKSETRKTISIRRHGKELFSFRIRPLDETEIGECRKKAARYAPSPANRNVRVEVDVDVVKLRSLEIYTATVEEDRARIWDNAKLKSKINVINGVDVVDELLMSGEKDHVCDEIDTISGYNSSLEEVAKN